MRSAEAHAALAATDPGLPALPVLLEDDRLAERLGAPVRRSYLRYKPGTSAIGLVEVDGRPAIATARPVSADDKRAKALRDVAPEDVLLDAPADGLLVVDALTDRHLPALRHLVGSGRATAWLTGLGHPVAEDTRPVTLAHKPARRWVGRLDTDRAGESVVLRAYARAGYDAALAAHGLLDPQRAPSLRLPRVIGTHRKGLIALEHLPGRTLDVTVPEAGVRRLGAAIGELHAGTQVDLVHPDHPSEVGLDPAVQVLSSVVARARQVEQRARAALRVGGGSVVHGDLSLDQVVADGHSLGLIDFDRVRVGNPLDDIASLLAAAALQGLGDGGAAAAATLMDRLRTPFVTGHAATWDRPTSDDLAPRTALALLSRAGEPFRAGGPDWPEVTEELVTLAEGLVPGRAVA